MNKLFLILIFSLSYVYGVGQLYQNPNPSLYGIRYNRGKFDSTLHYPTICGKPIGRAALKDNIYNQSAIVFDSCNNHFYAFNPKDSSWLCIDSSKNSIDTNAIHKSGDSTSAALIIGTKTNQNVQLIANNTNYLNIFPSLGRITGKLRFGTYNWYIDTMGNSQLAQLQVSNLISSSYLSMNNSDTGNSPIIPSNSGTFKYAYGTIWGKSASGYWKDLLNGGIGTITGVTAGLGMSGGGTSGNVTVNLDTGNAVVLSRQRAATTYENKINPPNLIKQYWTGYKTFATLLTDSINEGSSNLYFTTARARASVSATSPLNYNSTTGSFSINTLDSTIISGLHSEGYYNTKYNTILVSGTNIKTVNGNSLLGSGNLTVSGGLLGNGVVSSTLVPLAVWSTTNSTLSNSPNILYDTVTGKLYVSNSQTSINGLANAITYNPFTVASSYINNNNRLMIFNGSNYSAIQSYLSSNSSAMPTIINPYGGFVNIGTTDNPSRQLQVINANDYQLRLGYSTSFYYDMGRYGSDGYLHFYGAQSGADGYVFAGASGTKVTIASNGNTSISGNLTSTQYRLSSLNTAPISATDTGTTGEIRVTSTYIYICTATNTWVRTALSTF